ncbi:MAG: UDP-glucose 4-epimerase GalE [Candidatus Limnocylindria bacterium]
MRVLVTGGAGYIGSHTVRCLESRGDAVIVLDSLEHGHPASIGETPLVVADMGDRERLDRLFQSERIDAVVHFAGNKAVDESLREPVRYFENNVSKTLVLLDAMLRADVRMLVFSSSCAVYGTPDRQPVDEESELRPENPYGESKLLIERMLHWLDACRGLRHVSLRYFNAAGAALDGSIGENWANAANLVPVVMKAAMGVAPSVQVFGSDYPTADGSAIRDYIHVVDLADAHALALDHLAADGTSTTLNLGTGRGASVREVIAMTERVSGRRIVVQDAERRPGDPAAIWADNGRARSELGWSPRFGLEEIIESAWRWHSTHPNGFDDVAIARNLVQRSAQ